MKYRPTELKLGNSEIENWLNSRTWLTHYSGRGDFQFAKFSGFDEEDWKRESDNDFDKITECDTTGLPKGITNNKVDLLLEDMGTYSFPIVHLEIGTHRTREIFECKIHFNCLRGNDEWIQVFSGFPINLESLLVIFTFLGVDPKFLK